MKRIVVCCDGTWSVPDERCGDAPCPTNVTKIALSVAPRDRLAVQQIVFYGRGIGTGRWDHLAGGLFGVGISLRILDEYRFLIEVYEPGDELFLFGFSRGAYTARSLAGLIRNCGILERRFRDLVPQAYELYRRRDPASGPRAKEARLFRETYSYEREHGPMRITFIGVWDTVGSLGIPIGPLGWLSRRVLRLQFHDVQLSTFVENAFQALAIDERRRAFQPAIWEQQAEARGRQRLEQVWFAGVHSSVGGGAADAGLSDVAFEWMKERAARCGLEFGAAGQPETRPDPLAPYGDYGAGSSA